MFSVRKIILYYFLFFSTVFQFLNADEVLPADASSKFITLYIHGFLDNATNDAIFNSSTLFDGENAYPTVGYFRGDGVIASPYKQIDTPFSNFFFYRLPGGEERGLPEFPDWPALDVNGNVCTPAFSDYQVNPGKDYKMISDIFEEEIGDFNSGSRYLPEEQRQPFLGLAK